MTTIFSRNCLNSQHLWRVAMSLTGHWCYSAYSESAVFTESRGTPSGLIFAEDRGLPHDYRRIRHLIRADGSSLDAYEKPTSINFTLAPERDGLFMKYMGFTYFNDFPLVHNMRAELRSDRWTWIAAEKTGNQTTVCATHRGPRGETQRVFVLENTQPHLTLIKSYVEIQRGPEYANHIDKVQVVLMEYHETQGDLRKLRYYPQEHTRYRRAPDGTVIVTELGFPGEPSIEVEVLWCDPAVNAPFDPMDLRMFEPAVGTWLTLVSPGDDQGTPMRWNGHELIDAATFHAGDYDLSEFEARRAQVQQGGPFSQPRYTDTAWQARLDACRNDRKMWKTCGLESIQRDRVSWPTAQIMMDDLVRGAEGPPDTAANRTALRWFDAGLKR
jgi:hypothetical protein